MKKNKLLKLLALALCMATATCAMTGCGVIASAMESDSGEEDGTIVADSNARIAATSVACMEICEKLDLDLVGVPTTSLVEIPERYSDAVSLGTAMSPDMELLSSTDPDWVLSPISLYGDLQPKYENAGYNYAFLNLSSVEGMFQSISELGDLFDRKKEAAVLVGQYEAYMSEYSSKHKEGEGPRVLILMGIPGSYVVATENSYVGDLVKMAGGVNIYADCDEEFVSANTEDMLERNPEIILRTAHAMPEQVMAAFADEFATNDIWQHFEAVQNGKVYDLTTSYFGMSATFDYQNALEELEDIFYSDQE